MKRIVCTVIISLLAGCACMRAQEKSLYMVGTYRENEVKLRWALTDFRLWQRAQTEPVKLERFCFTPGKAALPVRTELEIIPYMEKDTALTSALAEKDPYAALLGEAVYAPRLDLVYNGDSTAPDWALLKEQADRDAFRFVMANTAYDRSFATACLGGMGFSDRNLESGKYYLYRAVFNGDTAIFFTRQEKTVPGNSLPVQEAEVEIKDGTAHICWPHAPEGTPCAGYYIDRAAGTSKKYTRLNDRPYTDLVQNQNRYVCFTDSVPDPSKTYKYRISALDLFGYETVVAASRAARNTEFLHTPPVLDSVTAVKKGYKVFWSFPAEEENLVKSFSVYVQKNPADALSEPALAGGMPANQRVCFVDGRQTPPSGYYFVLAEGYNGETFLSLPVFLQQADSMPPAPPAGLKAQVDSSGVLMLTWNASPETDLQGYRVFFALTPESEPVQITSAAITDTVYTDTLSLITPQKFCFGVKAEDNRGNLSEMSDYVRVSNGRPDKPVPAVFNLRCPEKEKETELQWTNSPDKAVRRLVLQYKADSSDWIELKTFEKKRPDDSLPSSFRFKYPASLYNRLYSFRLMACGEDVQRDTSYSPFCYKVEKLADLQAPRPRLTPDRDRKFIHVQWNACARSDLKKVYIYRKKENEKTLLLAVLADGRQNEGFYVDSRVSMNTSYGYKIQLEFSDGSYSGFSQESRVEY